MRALVTGAAGFIGSHVTRALADRGLAIVATDRPGAALSRLARVDGRVQTEEADLADPESAAALLRRHRPELLVHLAWYAHPADYLDSRENLRSLAATSMLLAAAADAGCRRVVGVGTCLEYAASEAPHREGDAAAPDTLYAACKHAAHLVGDQLTVGRTSFAWSRIFHVHGPGEDPARLIPMVARRLCRGEAVDLSTGDQIRDYLHVEDVADALAAIALSDVRGSANVCSGVPVAISDVLRTLGELLGKPDLLRFGRAPYRAGERMHIVGDPGVLRTLGWAPRHTGLAASLAYLRDARA